MREEKPRWKPQINISNSINTISEKKMSSLMIMKRKKEKEKEKTSLKNKRINTCTMISSSDKKTMTT